MSRNNNTPVIAHRDSSSIRTLPHRHTIIPNSCLIVTSHEVFSLDAAIFDAAAVPFNNQSFKADVDPLPRSLHRKLGTTPAPLDKKSSGTHIHSATRTLHMELRTTSAPLDDKSSRTNIHSATTSLHMKLGIAKSRRLHSGVGGLYSS